jgi:hypothetical protein
MKHTARESCSDYSLLLGGFSLVYFDPEDGVYAFLRNVVNFYWTAKLYIPEDTTPHYRRCENLKFSTVLPFLYYIQDSCKSDVLCFIFFFKKLVTDA